MVKRLMPFLLLLCAGSSFAQLNLWRWQNPLPVGNYLRAVQMISADVIYACGDNGSFMSSHDGGASWELQGNILKSKANFYSLSFLDQNYGMCCGDSGMVIRTTDGGKSWTALPTQTKSKLNSIVVVDTNTAVAITSGGSIVRTENGGSNWKIIFLEGNQELFSIRKLRPDFLTVTGFGGVVMKSTDQGKNWFPFQTKIGNSFYSGIFTSDSIATIIGEYGLILHTSDGGKNWTHEQLADSSIITTTLNVIDSKDPNVFAIVGDYATILYTKDGGSTWNRSFLEGTAVNIKGLSFFDAMTATAVGANGMVLHSSDGGATWTFLPHQPYTQILHAVAFPKADTSLGLAVGNNGTILRTDDGGKNWTLIPIGYSHILYGVCFLDKSTAVAVGEQGAILKSVDAGLTWEAQLSSTSHPLYAVSFSTPETGIAVGDSGIILQSFSAGAFWTRRYTTPPTFSDYFTGVSTPDSAHAFICGASSIFASKDGGISWSKLPGAFDSRGKSISFSDSLHGGYAFADKFGKGYTRCTTNGGITFDSVYPAGITGGLNAICFSDRLHGTIVGTAGYIGHTTNGGQSWISQQSNTLNTLNAVAFGTAKAGTTVGYQGNILRITTKESLGIPEVSPSGTPKIILDANYPNPFSRSTTISYTLPSSGFTTVEIFSLDGKPIATLFHEFQIAGDHSVGFDVAELASGTYILLVKSGASNASREIMVLK